MLTTDSRAAGMEDHSNDPVPPSVASRPDLLASVSQAQQRVLEFLLAGLTEPS